MRYKSYLHHFQARISDKVQKSDKWIKTEKPEELVFWALMASREGDKEQTVSETLQGDGRVELQESVRLRDRVKKNGDLRERDSKRRRIREDDEASEESFNGDDGDEENRATAAAGCRPFPPPLGSVSNHHLQHRKSYPPDFSSTSSSSKILRASPVWKPGDGFIRSSIPRKPRSASTRRSHDWNWSSSNNINVCGGYGDGKIEQVFRQVSVSPTSQSGAVSTSTPKCNNTGSNLKPPKPAPSKQNSSNREDLEIEIAEVLYGLMTQSQNQSSKKEESIESSRSNDDAKSPPNSTSGLAQSVAPKRKSPRQADEYPGHDDQLDPYSDKVSSPSPAKISGPTGENGFEVKGNLVNSQEQPAAEPEESCVVKNEDKFCNDSGSTSTAFSPVLKIKVKSNVSEMDIEREQKFEIDLMAPSPSPQARSSPESQKSILSTVDAEPKSEMSNDKENENKLQQQQEMLIETNKEDKPGQPKSSSALPLPTGSWPGGLPPMGPLQGVIPVDGPVVAPTIPPLFTQPRRKRCATHSYIARNIHSMQQLIKMNPFWQAAAGPTSLFGPVDPVGIVDGKVLNNNNDKSSQNVISSDSIQRKQQIPIQPALPTVAPSNLLGPTFIFPYHQQAAVAAAASARPKPPSATGGSASTNPSSSAGAQYPLPVNESQYLAILQKNGYPFPIPPIGLPPNYWGLPSQATPFFNGSFYPSQMIHPSQVQHHQRTPPAQPSQNNLSGQKPRPQSSGGPGSTNNPTQKSQRSSQQSLQSGREDSPTTTTDSSRASQARAPVNMYGPNFTTPINPQNLAVMTQNHAIFQNFPEATKQNIQNMIAAAAQAAQNNNNFGISEKDKSRDGQNGFRQQSIAFSRSDLTDSSSDRAPNVRTFRPVMNNASSAMNVSSGHHHIQGQIQLQQQLKQQQHMSISRSKTQVTSNGPVFTENLKNNLLQNLAQNNISPSLASSTPLKNHNSRPTTQTHNQISFGANPKPTTNSQGQVPMTPTNSSVSKGSSRMASSNSTNTETGQGPIFPAQQLKNLQSILGNTNAVKTQMQPQLFFSNPCSKAQSPHSTGTSSITSGPNGFYMQRQNQQHGPLKSASTNDPAKAFAVATSKVIGGGSSSLGIRQAAQFGGPKGGTHLPVGFSYINPVPAAVHVKPAEQKQPAGNDKK
ncbi:hypothetical protein CASFOL_021605 [Castilleja foliolosa]|uniref:Protein TIME FOR COFFEE n=1 Tax=Castilleja foliolosa TaxID=1961234 RepID=A0ABD3CX07_9LAMI